MRRNVSQTSGVRRRIVRCNSLVGPHSSAPRVVPSVSEKNCLRRRRAVASPASIAEGRGQTSRCAHYAACWTSAPLTLLPLTSILSRFRGLSVCGVVMGHAPARRSLKHVSYVVLMEICTRRRNLRRSWFVVYWYVSTVGLMNWSCAWCRAITATQMVSLSVISLSTAVLRLSASYCICICVLQRHCMFYWLGSTL